MKRLFARSRKSISTILSVLVLLVISAKPSAGDVGNEAGANGLLQTGAATYSIPIEVPPGRGGIAPNLVLRYNSYQKNGWIGVGWNLDMGAIQRSTKRKKGVKSLLDSFILPPYYAGKIKSGSGLCLTLETYTRDSATCRCEYIGHRPSD